jgi:FKBP-type peptidyl-prolyl cis-trans isomerase FkpA
VRRIPVLTSLLANAAIPLLMAQTAPPPKPKPAAVPRKIPAKRSAPARKPAVTAPMTEEQKTIYALGLSIYKSLGQFDLSPAEVDLVKKGLTDAAANKPFVDLQAYGPKIGGLQHERSARVAAKEKTASAAFLATAAGAPGAVKTDSGLIYKELTLGTGESPKATDTVKVNYRGTLVNGTEFDSSYARNEPIEFPLNNVIPCWTEGVQRMKIGGKAQLVCPSNIAYGDSGHPPVIPGGATLVFEIELLGITPAK